MSTNNYEVTVCRVDTARFTVTGQELEEALALEGVTGGANTDADAEAKASVLRRLAITCMQSEDLLDHRMFSVRWGAGVDDALLKTTNMKEKE